jgi:hypothetical protein
MAYIYICIFWHFSDILSYVYSDILSDILSGINSGILSDLYSDILCVRNYVRVVCQGGMHPQVTITACNWEQTT